MPRPIGQSLSVRSVRRGFQCAGEILGDRPLRFVLEHEGGEGQIDLDHDLVAFDASLAADGEGEAAEGELDGILRRMDHQVLTLEVVHGLFQRRPDAGQGFGRRQGVRDANDELGHWGSPFPRAAATRDSEALTPPAA